MNGLERLKSLGKFVRKPGAVLAVGLSLSVAAIIIGCGGGGGGGGSDSGGSQAPTGNEAVRSTAVGSYQSQAAGIAYPFAAVVAAAPSGSALKTLASFSPRYHLYAVHPSTSTLTLNTELGLYTDGGVTSGGKLVYSFYVDSAGKTPAGTMVLSSGAGTFSYTSYPATIKVAVTVTAGNLPCNGQATIIYNGPSGKNTLQGSLSLTKNQEVVSVDLALSSSLNVTGSITVTENHTSIVGTDVSGPLGGNLACNFTLSPQGYFGTAKLNLLTGAVSLNFTSPKGASSSTDASGNVVITYPDGSTQTISNPLTTGLLGTTGTGSNGSTSSTSSTATGSTASTGSTATTGGTSGLSSYNVTQITPTPQLISYVSPDGRMVGQNSKGVWSYWASPTSTPQPLATTPNATILNVWSVNTKGHILASATNQTSGQLAPLFWKAYNQAPTLMSDIQNTSASIDAHMWLNSEDQVLVNYSGYYYASPTSAPVVTGDTVSGISDVGTAIGVQNGEQVVWPSLPPTGTPIEIPGNENDFIGANGTIALANGGTVNVVEPSNLHQQTALKVPTHENVAWVTGVGPIGHVLGYSYGSSSNDVIGVIWKTPTSTPLTFDEIGKFSTNVCLFETSAGAIILGAGTPIDGPFNGYYVLTPK